ncbi:hypothetical protein JBE04_18005 [Streptomyces sp. PRKS01-29]|nr:hypothetical protein [Streptomyces sabulosicollis]MBI0296306.1 hypothetical protein [Streptomyces sabulosicollis]
MIHGMLDVRVFSVPDPLPYVDVLLPNKGGKLRGKIATLEGRPDGAVWVEVLVPSWARWSTQLAVGEPSIEGIGPDTVRLWAPSAAVFAQEEDHLRLRRLYREGLAST